MTAIAHRPHRVSTAVADTRSVLAGVAGASLWSMDATETAATLGDVLAAEAQLAELKCRLLVRAQEVGLPGQVGATSTANWYAAQHRVSRPAAHRALRLATALEAHEPTRDLLATGRLRAEQAEAVIRAVEELPEDLDPAVVEDAERHLLAEADHFDAVALKRLGRRLLEAVAPDAGRGPRGRAARARGARRRRLPAADDVGGRARQGPRPVHRRRPHRGDPQEGTPRLRRPQAPGLRARCQRPCRPTQADR